LWHLWRRLHSDGPASPTAGEALAARIEGFNVLLKVWRFLTIMLTAFSLSLSMAHLLEFPQRMKFDQQLWVRVTVFQEVYKYFGDVGSIFEVGAILTAIVLIFLVRGRGSVFYWTLGGALLLVAAFASWILFVNSANAELARWLTNPVPPDWTSTRNQWEYAHAINALIKIGGLSLLVVSVLVEAPESEARRSRIHP
jgi:hypothetical protein